MTEKEIFDEIVKLPKWYAGLRTETGRFHDASSATKLKQRFYNGTLSADKIKQIFNKHGYIKPEVQWEKVS